ncbi:MAG TPA: hypothetical protein VM925_05035, partial [Labilithrix sp.]|nr:hypothetical protein [Labilithrix sp.]
WKVNEGPEKSSVLTIDFPKGDFLPTASAQASSDAPAGDQQAGTEAPAPAKAPPNASAGKRAGAKVAPVKKEPARADGPKP